MKVMVKVYDTTNLCAMTAEHPTAPTIAPESAGIRKSSTGSLSSPRAMVA